MKNSEHCLLPVFIRAAFIKPDLCMCGLLYQQRRLHYVANESECWDYSIFAVRMSLRWFFLCLQTNIINSNGNQPDWIKKWCLVYSRTFLLRYIKTLCVCLIFCFYQTVLRSFRHTVHHVLSNIKPIPMRPLFHYNVIHELINNSWYGDGQVCKV